MRRHLITISEKLEFMIVSLGGQPDQTAQESMRSLNEYQKKIEAILYNIKQLQIVLKEREDVIKVYGFSHKDRIMKDNSFKTTKEEAEQQLNELKEVFK